MKNYQVTEEYIWILHWNEDQLWKKSLKLIKNAHLWHNTMKQYKRINNNILHGFLGQGGERGSLQNRTIEEFDCKDNILFIKFNGDGILLNLGIL